MPVHFTCPHCTQLLSVGRRKVGNVVRCVTCNGSVLVPPPYEEVSNEVVRNKTVPTETVPIETVLDEEFSKSSGSYDQAEGHESTHAVPLSRESHPTTSSENATRPAANQLPTPPPRVQDETYDSLMQPSATESAFEDVSGAGLRRDTIQISRTILYAIGGVIVAVGIGAFGLGWGMARSLAPVRIQTAANHHVRGSVNYVTRHGQLAPDTQSVIVALPRRKLPDQKFSPESLRPENLSFRTNQTPAVAGIRSLGGDVAITDQSGSYELEVSEAGEYFVLILSSHVARPANKQPSSTEIVELGRYFRQANDLFEKNAYVWGKHFVRKSKQLDTIFER